MNKYSIPQTSSCSRSSPLSESQVIRHIKTCQSIAVEISSELFGRFLQKLDTRLTEFCGNAKSNQEQNQLIETQRDFHAGSDELEQYFCGYLGEGFIKFKNKQLDTHTGEEKFQGDMLSLVENEDLEETIAISSITHRAETYYGEALWALNQRFSVINDGEKVNERGNPVAPVQFCESLRKALMIMPVGTKAKIIAYKVFDKEFISQLSSLYEQINHYLVEQSILPNLRYNPQTATGVAMREHRGQQEGASHAADGGDNDLQLTVGGKSNNTGGVLPAPDPALPSNEYQSSLVDAIRALQGHVTGFNGRQESSTVAGIPAAASPQAAVYSNQELMGALQNLQGQALSATQQIQENDSGQPIPVQTIAVFNNQLATQLRQSKDDGAVDAEEMYTIDLVGMLFEYMLSDDNLPDSVKALLSYLHTPFLKIAFIDMDFFQEAEHPARLLLNNLAEAGVRWVGNDGTSQYEIYEKIKAIVSQLLEQFKNDVRLFTKLLLEFSAYTKKISRRQDLVERRAMEKVQGEEKLREVKIRVNDEVRGRTDGRELPSAVLLLLLQPWSDYLAFVLLRYGDKSDSWVRALKVVDYILWSIQPKQDIADKTRQVELHDDLLDTIEAGFETIGYDQAKGKKLLEALVSLQKMALQSKRAKPAPAPMRDKLETQAAERAGQNTNREEVTQEEQKMVENLKMIEFGTWFEFEGGKRLKVAWYNSKTLHYMLVNQMGKKVAMTSGVELAREMLAGNAKIIAGSSKPFFERALENIFHSLNARVEAIKQEEKGRE